MNTFGRQLRLSTWGESHGEAIGGILDGFPAGFALDLESVQEALRRRAPGQGRHTTPRREPDLVEVLSGVYEGRTTGTPIAFIIRNTNQKSRDYEELRTSYRPGHADITYMQKYGHRDHRGGGRASARETAIRVVAGAMAAQWLYAQHGTEIFAYPASIGRVGFRSDGDLYPYNVEALREARSAILALPDAELAEAMLAEIEDARSMGDSVGGVITCVATSVPVGLGEPIYDKMEARLGSAMLSINASRAFELGDGFALASMRGSEANDGMSWAELGERVDYHSNHGGGTLGGITTGQELRMRIAFKPAPSISQAQDACSDTGDIRLCVEGRHDPSVVPRALPVVEAMCALVLMDMCLLSEGYVRELR